jgi:hypothetical protein
MAAKAEGFDIAVLEASEMGLLFKDRNAIPLCTIILFAMDRRRKPALSTKKEMAAQRKTRRT